MGKMSYLIFILLIVVIVKNNFIRAQDDSICTGPTPQNDPDQCCKIPIMVDDQFASSIMDRIQQWVRVGNADMAVCKATQFVLEDLNILKDGLRDLDVAHTFFYDALPDEKALANEWRMASTDCLEWIKDNHLDDYQREHGFPKEDCNVQSEVLIFCTVTRVTAVKKFVKFQI
jgi:hypothetical protein